jgi:hypothetical protein
MIESFKLPEGDWGVNPKCDLFDGSTSVGFCTVVHSEDAVVARVGGDIPHHLNVAQLFRFSRELFALAERVAYHFENQNHPIGDAARDLLKRVQGGA